MKIFQSQKHQKKKKRNKKDYPKPLEAKEVASRRDGETITKAVGDIITSALRPPGASILLHSLSFFFYSLFSLLDSNRKRKKKEKEKKIKNKRPEKKHKATRSLNLHGYSLQNYPSNPPGTILRVFRD